MYDMFNEAKKEKKCQTTVKIIKSWKSCKSALLQDLEYFMLFVFFFLRLNFISKNSLIL